MSHQIYTVELINKADIEQVIHFLKQSFFKDEPLSHHLGLADCPEQEVWARDFDLQCSFKAINPAGEIVGAIINSVVDKKNYPAPYDTESCTNNYLQIYHLLQHIDANFNVFDQYPQCPYAVETKLMSVHESYRAAGICKQLTRSTIEWMRNNAMRLYFIMCTNEYSTRTCRRLGFTEMYTLKYTDYIVDGTNPIRPDAPHDACRVFAKIV